MNAKKLNFTRLNTSVLNASLLNSSLMGGRGKGSSRPSGLIAQYKPYLNSNDSPTRDVLKDYSGNGNDIVLHNFAYAWMSGYDAIPSYCDFNGFNGVPPDSEIIDRFKVVIHSYSGNAGMYYRYKNFSVGDLVDLRFQVKGLSGDASVKIEGLSDNWNVSINERDICSCSCIVEREGTFVFRIKGTFQNTVIEFLPPFPGALVSDGVDDYGVCETPLGEVGTIIIMLDEIKWDASKYLYDAGTGLEINSNRIYCWKLANGNIKSGVTNEEQGYISKQTPIDGKFIVFTRNPNEITSDLYLFVTSGKGGISVALYSLEIYDHDLTEEEIETVKQRMIAEYEKATGNVLQPTEDNAWLYGDGDTVLWGDGTNVLTE